METYRTEEEQIEAIKGAWEKHGNSIVTGIILALGVVFSYQFWTNSNIEKAEAASDAYELVIEAQQTVFAEGSSDEDRTNLISLANGVISDYESSTYAQLTAFLLAKMAVEEGNPEEAAKQLQWIIDRKPNKGIELTAKLRLAKVNLAQEKYDEALAVLNSESSGSHKAAYEELKGDVYRLKGENDKARNAYQLAVGAVKSSGSFVNPLLQMKLDDLAVQ